MEHSWRLRERQETTEPGAGPVIEAYQGARDLPGRQWGPALKALEQQSTRSGVRSGASVWLPSGEWIGKVSLEAVGPEEGTFSSELRRSSELEQWLWEGKGEDMFKGPSTHRMDGVGFGQVGAACRKRPARNAGMKDAFGGRTKCPWAREAGSIL